MTYSHFSSEPIDAIRQTKQTNRHFKPHGLWLSVDGEYGWDEWCNDNEFGTIEDQYHYLVVLNEDANILYLKSTEDIREFTKRYVRESRFGGDIDWIKVAQDYDGIVITPHSWELRLDFDTRWYYGWDIASGCIWCPSVIDKIELTRKPKGEEK